MLSSRRPLGRLSFIVQVSLLNIVIFLAALIALTFQPSGGGHLAVLIVIGAMQYFWFVLHARRFTDAGRSFFWPVIAGASCFASFAFTYMTLAVLWSSPEVQAEAFRTGGGLTSGSLRHIETNPLVIESGRMITNILGAAGALVLSGLAVTVMGLTAFVSGIFSIITFILPGGRSGGSNAGRTENRTQALGAPNGQAASAFLRWFSIKKP